MYLSEIDLKSEHCTNPETPDSNLGKALYKNHLPEEMPCAQERAAEEMDCNSIVLF